MTKSSDHDQRFKTLLREFFADFMCLFFREWADRMEFSHVKWLNTEVFDDPPGGSRHVLDLIAELPIRFPTDKKQSALPRQSALIHVEIESEDKATRLESRRLYYSHFLKFKYKRKVLLIAV
ncbi:MAG: hypothetical protein ACFCD0_06815 [Gemmataceae bacterium]